MPDWFSQNAPSAAAPAGAPADPAGDWFGLNAPGRKPASAEDFMKPEDIANRDNGTPLSLDVLKGFGKRAASSVADVGEMAAASLNVPGVRADLFNPVLRHPIFQRLSEATKATNKAQELGGNLELAAELAGPAVSVAKAVPALAKGAVSAAKALPSAVRVGGPVLVDLATGNYLKAGRRLLGAALEGGKFAEELPKVAEELKAPPVMTGTATAPPQVIGAPGGFSMPVGPPPKPVLPPPGRVVAPPARIAAEDQIAAALAESGPPAMPPVELPPPAALPPGYTPRATVPASARPAAARAPAATPAPPAAIPEPSLAEQLQASLEAQAGAAPRAPAADRVPKAVKARMAKAGPKTAPEPPKRAYFLKSPEAIAAVEDVPEAIAPSGSIDMADLPEAWKSHTGQDLFPTTGAEAKAMRTALRAEIKDRGMTVGQAIAAVSKNKDIPTPLRAQMLRSLRGGGEVAPARSAPESYFHGTHPESAEAIRSSGVIRASEKGTVGPAVYLSPTEEGALYTRNPQLSSSVKSAGGKQPSVALPVRVSGKVFDAGTMESKGGPSMYLKPQIHAALKLDPTADIGELIRNPSAAPKILKDHGYVGVKWQFADGRPATAVFDPSDIHVGGGK